MNITNQTILELVSNRNYSKLISILNEEFTEFGNIGPNTLDSKSALNLSVSKNVQHELHILNLLIESVLWSDYVLNQAEFNRVIRHYRIINDVRFAINSGNNDIFDYYWEKVNKTTVDIYKLIISYDIYESKIEPEELINLLPELDRAVAMFSMLGIRGNYTEKIYNRKVKLYKLICESNMMISSSVLSVMTWPYMYVTYMGDKLLEKDVKITLGKIYEKINKQILSDKKLSKIVKINNIKRKVLLIAEQWGENHPIKRCYREFVVEMKMNNYEVGLMAAPAVLSRTDKDDFDYIIEASTSNHIKNISEIERLNIDAIFYPSIGMAPWVIMLASRRIANFQFCSGGHPSNPYLSTIDKFYGDEFSFNVEYPEGGVPLAKISNVHLINAKNKSTLSLSNTKVIEKVSINAMIAKLSNDFLEFLDELYKEHKVIFHFHIAEQEVNMKRLTMMLKKRYNNCIIDGYLPYEQYMARLSSSIISIPTFPFGHANSVMDSLVADVLPIIYVDDFYASRTALAVVGANLVDNDEILFNDKAAMLHKIKNLMNNLDQLKNLIIKYKNLSNSRVIPGGSNFVDLLSQDLTNKKVLNN